MTPDSCAAARDASSRGQRVLIVSEEASCSVDRELSCKGLSSLTGVRVVCIDGVKAIEVVLLRDLKTGELIGVNASAVLIAVPVAEGVISSAIRVHVNHAIAASPGN